MKNQKFIGALIAAFVVALLLWAGFGTALRSGSRGGLSNQIGLAAPITKKANAPESGAKTSAGKQNKGSVQRSGRDPTMVVLSQVQAGLTNDRLNAIGNGDALASVTVVPLSNGVLTSVLAVSGQKISVGDVLANMDSDAEKIALDRASRAIADARLSLTRFESLQKSRSITQVQLDQARTDLENAKLAERDATLTLARRSITAPIAGIVGIVAVQTGDSVNRQTEIATIDDRSSLIVDFWVPERFTSLIRKGQSVEATAYAVPGVAFSGVVNAVGSRVEEDSRTLQVRAEINNLQDTLRPGMSFSVKMRFPGNTFPAVDPLAVQWDSDGSYVWKVVDGKARRTVVRIVQRNPESVLVAGELALEELVVVQGVLSLRNGALVKEVGASDDSRSGN